MRAFTWWHPLNAMIWHQAVTPRYTQSNGSTNYTNTNCHRCSGPFPTWEYCLHRTYTHLAFQSPLGHLEHLVWGKHHVTCYCSVLFRRQWPVNRRPVQYRYNIFPSHFPSVDGLGPWMQSLWIQSHLYSLGPRTSLTQPSRVLTLNRRQSSMFVNYTVTQKRPLTNGKSNSIYTLQTYINLLCKVCTWLCLAGTH